LLRLLSPDHPQPTSSFLHHTNFDPISKNFCDDFQMLREHRRPDFFLVQGFPNSELARSQATTTTSNKKSASKMMCLSHN
jgi:hypothetical protein